MAAPVVHKYPFLGGVKKTSARAKCLLIYSLLKILLWVLILIAVLKRGQVGPMPYAPCPMPCLAYALCPMPYALCPIPDSTSCY